MHTKIRRSICLLGLLTVNPGAYGFEASADSPNSTHFLIAALTEAAQVSDTRSGSSATRLERRGVGAPEAPPHLQPKKQADAQASAGSPAIGIPAGSSLAVEHSALGKARARLLAEMNKSLKVELPPAEFLVQPNEGATRVENLSLLDAAALALGYSNEVAASTAKRDMSNYYAAASLGPLLPRADLKINGGREESSPATRTKQLGERYSSDTHNRTDQQLYIRQTLMDLPSYFERQRQNLLLKSAEHGLSNTQERVAYDTLVSFLKLIQLRMDVVLAKNYETELKKLLEYMTARAEAGGSSSADMQRVKGRVINTRSIVIEAQGAYESGLVEFRRLTGVVPSSITIPENLLPELPNDFETSMAAAVQNNFELQAALRDMESVAQERRAMQGKLAPKLEIELSSIRSYNAGGIADSDPSCLEPNCFAAQNDKRAMIVMSWNLLNGGADMMQAKALASKRLEYEYRAKEIQRKLEEAIRVNFNALRSISGRIEGVRQEMESNDLVLAAFNEQLFAANRSLLDVLDAYQRQYNSRTELARLLTAEATAGLQMLRNMGQLQEGIAALR